VSSNLKVLVISHLYPNNINPVRGIFVHNQVNRLADCGAEIAVVCPVMWSPPILSLLNNRWRNYSKIHRKAQIGRFEIEYPRYLRPPGQLWYIPFEGMACYLGIKNVIKDIYRRFPFDIIYSNALIPAGYAGCLIACKLGLPSVCYVGESYIEHLYYSKFTKKKLVDVITNSTRIVSASSKLRDNVLRIANPKEPVEVIYRGTDTQLFKPLDINLKLKRQLGLPDNSVVIVFVGWLVKRKGVSDLLNAFGMVATKFPQAYLLIIGEGPERENLRSLSRIMGIDKRVIFTGVVKNEEIPSYHSITDVMVFPSYAEGLPNAVVEAVACGKPVVATNVGGIPEVITPGINGFLITAGDVKTLSSNIIQILTNTTLRKQMGRMSRQIAETRFNASKNAESLSDLFRQIIREHVDKARI
jgi:glycosyltransferase involved in cell wall biosynthesis